MTKAQALKLATKLWGTRAAVRDEGAKFRDGTPRPTAAERAVLRAELPIHRAAKPEQPDVKTFGDSRTIGEYRAALAAWGQAWKAWKEREQHIISCLHGERYSVGEIMQLLGAFHVRGAGDTWEEAFEKAGVIVKAP